MESLLVLEIVEVDIEIPEYTCAIYETLVSFPILILRLTAPSGRRAVRVAYGRGLLDRASSSGSNFTFSFLSIFLCVLFLSSTFLCSIFCLQLFFCLFLLFFLNFCVKKFSPNFLSHNLLLNFFGS